MSNKYDEKYFKFYVIKTLEYCYNSSWDCLKFDEKTESPDLQSSKLNIGIEVTRSLKPKKGEINSIFNSYVEKELCYERTEERIKKLGGQIYKSGDSTVMCPTNGLVYFKNHIDNLVNSIKIKTEKLNNHYKIYNENFLYVFTGTACLNKNDIKESINRVLSEIGKYKLKFDSYFIDCIDKLFVVESGKDKIEEIIISNDIFQKIKSETMAYSIGS